MARATSNRSDHGTCTLMGRELAEFKIPLPDLEPHFFRTLLHELMTAKLRVHELEIPETAN